MIESSYWRMELRRDLAWLKSHRKYRRWSEKQQVIFERKLMLVAFQVRCLLERPKVNHQTRSMTMPVLHYKKVGDLPFTVMGSGSIHDRFDMEHPEATFLPALDVCNQLIHYYWMQTLPESQAYVSMIVFSDYKRHKFAYEMRITDLLQLFRIYSRDTSAIVGMECRWDDRVQDYVVTKS